MRKQLTPTLRAGRAGRAGRQWRRGCNWVGNGQHVATAGVMPVAWPAELAALTSEAAFYSNALPLHEICVGSKGQNGGVHEAGSVKHGNRSGEDMGEKEGSPTVAGLPVKEVCLSKKLGADYLTVGWVSCCGTSAVLRAWEGGLIQLAGAQRPPPGRHAQHAAGGPGLPAAYFLGSWR